MAQITLEIDGQKVEAQEGEKLLSVALRAGFYIPHLCARTDMELPFGGCRLCWVEIEGWRRPVTSCTVSATEGMVVTTRTPAVDRLVASAYEMLLSHHNLDCRHCGANRKCDLQRIAIKRRLKLKVKNLPKLPIDIPVDDSHPEIRFDRSRCVLCGQCVWVCKKEGVGVFDFARRGLDTIIGTYGDLPLGQTPCNGCMACVEACPTGALLAK